VTGVVMLTGVTGFVGRQVLRKLREMGVRVLAVVRDDKHDQIAKIEGIEKIVTTPDLFAEDAKWWANVFQGVDTVIHLAWYAQPGEYLHSSRNLDCLVGTIELAKGAAEAGVRRFVGIGTCFEYDVSRGVLSVDTPLRPLSTYAGTKAAAYMALSQWFTQKNIEFAWCRLFYLYGEGEDDRRLVPTLRKKLSANEPAELSSGEQIRDFLDVQEAGRLIVNIALSDRDGAINICSGVPITVKQLAENIADEYNLRHLLKFGARPANMFDPAIVIGVPNFN
jgi:nucleoside-diphosphate-sugar epimerase